MEINKMNIFQKMSAITEEITNVAKNLSVGVGKSQYKAVGEADVLSAVKPIEIKYGVYSYPVNRKIIETNILTTKTEYDEKTTEKNQLFMRLETIYRFVNTDNSTEYIDITTYGDGVDSQDKAPGKAMTYSDKYALLKAYKIETGEDPDQKASESLTKVEIKKIKVSEEIQKEVEKVGGTLEKIAQYYKCKVTDLTDEMCQRIIDVKKKINNTDVVV